MNPYYAVFVVVVIAAYSVTNVNKERRPPHSTLTQSCNIHDQKPTPKNYV
jgi:hypothetical protein